MTFPDKVEQWRGIARAAFVDLASQNPDVFSSVDALGLTNDAFIDTILAIIQKESSGSANAIGDSGNSVGLMQLNFGAGTPQGLGYTGTKEGLFDPYTNVLWGTTLLLKLAGKYKDIEKVILAYNAGSFRVNESGVPINLSYLQNVLTFLGEKKTSRWSLPSLASSRGASSDGALDTHHTHDRERDIHHKN